MLSSGMSADAAQHTIQAGTLGSPLAPFLPRFLLGAAAAAAERFSALTSYSGQQLDL